MKNIFSVGLLLTPAIVLADPGHGAPVFHTHPWEVVGWVTVGIVAGYALFKLATHK